MDLLETEMANPRRKRPKHPSETDYNQITADEARSLAISDGLKGKKRSKRLDARAIRGARPREDAIIKSFYDSVNLPEFKEALKFSKDPKFEMLLAAICNPRLSSHSFADLCKRCDLTINDLATIWRNHQLSRAMMNWMNEIPDLMDDVMGDSRTRMSVCPKCAGVGKLREETINAKKNPICPVCNGDGQIRNIGDKDSRNTVFEGIGMKKSGGMTQNVHVMTVNQGLPALEDDLADMEKVVEAEFMEVEDVREEPQDSEADQEGSETRQIESGEDPDNAVEQAESGE